MSKFRYLIERGIPQEEIVDGEGGKLEVVTADLFVTVVTPDDDTGSSGGKAYRTLEEAQAQAEADHKYDGSEDPEDHPIVWKDPPQAWQPDALAVSQYFDDGIEPNPVG
jgi:hypothetical protein